MTEGDGARNSETLERSPSDELASHPRASGAAASDLVGRSLLHFRVVERLGEGGMGVVYRAVDEKLRRSVALKVLSARYLADDRNSELLFREARAAASVGHPNIGAIHELHDATDPAFIVMEFAAGETLRARIERKPIAIDEAIAIARSIASALAAAHESGLVHRDLKPENVMVSAAGVVKVLDFGLAKVAHEADPIASSTEAPRVAHALALTVPASSHSTRKGRVMGTLPYMSPEQSRGDVVDARTDVFAFGVVLYEMLARQLPFERTANEPWNWGDAQSSDWRVRAPIQRANPRTPRALAKIVERCLAYEAAERFANGAEIVRALEDVGVRDRNWTVPAVVGGVACAVGVALFANARAHRNEGATPASSAAIVADTRECTKSTECVKKNRGKPFVCNARNVCAAIETEQCHASYEPGDLERDDTVWIGAMFPTSGDQAYYGVLEMNAVELGRRDFAEAMKHLTPRAGETPARPLGLVECDDGAGDPERMARHLVEDVGVPAVIGFRTSVETLDLATSIFVPHDVMTVASISVSARLDGIPQGPGPRMVWRTTYEAGSTAKAIAALIERRESELRLGPAKAMRVALVRPKNRNVESFGEQLMASVRFNGKSALENDALYREFALDEAGEHENDDRTARDIAAFAPDVVVAIAEGEFLERIERAWRGAAARPFYIANTAIAPDLVRFLAKEPSRRQRFFGLTPVSTTAPNARFVLHYNETFKDPVTRTFAPNGSYDAFYLVAYASYGASAVDGQGLARSVKKVVSGSTHVDVGPSGILAAFGVLRRGEPINLDGALGTLDFDLETGEAPVDFAIVCGDIDANGHVVGSVDSGLVYDAERQTLKGQARCP